MHSLEKQKVNKYLEYFSQDEFGILCGGGLLLKTEIIITAIIFIENMNLSWGKPN